MTLAEWLRSSLCLKHEEMKWDNPLWQHCSQTWLMPGVVEGFLSCIRDGRLRNWVMVSLVIFQGQMDASPCSALVSDMHDGTWSLWPPFITCKWWRKLMGHSGGLVYFNLLAPHSVKYIIYLNYHTLATTKVLLLLQGGHKFRFNAFKQFLLSLKHDLNPLFCVSLSLVCLGWSMQERAH